MSKRRNRRRFYPEFMGDEEYRQVISAEAAADAMQEMPQEKTQAQSYKSKSDQIRDQFDKSLNKPLPDAIFEQLEGGKNSERYESMFKRIDLMQKEYIEKKLGVMKSDEFVKKIELNTEAVKNKPEAVHVFEHSKTKPAEPEKYNDYPFDDKPYKIIEEAPTDYNDFPDEEDEPLPEAEPENVQENAAEPETGQPDNPPAEPDMSFFRKPNRIFEIDENEPEPEVLPEPEILPEPEETTEADPAMPFDFEPEHIMIDEMPDEGGGYTDIPRDDYISGAEEEAPAEADENGRTPFDVEKAVEYAYRWALGRNPDYYDYEEIGGDCTNYISQILLAGGCQMDRTPLTGWYYKNANDKTPSWTGVEQLYDYLTEIRESGVSAAEIPLSQARAGDIVQLSFNGKSFQHTPFIVKVIPSQSGDITPANIYICAHSYDSSNRALDTYKYKKIRLIRIIYAI